MKFRKYLGKSDLAPGVPDGKIHHITLNSDIRRNGSISPFYCRGDGNQYVGIIIKEYFRSAQVLCLKQIGQKSIEQFIQGFRIL